jgi:tetratricopeptide (TPR) repeat protein
VPDELPVPTATEPDLAVHNLEVQIESTERELAKAQLDPTLRPMLVGFLMTHGEFIGRIADYETAEALGEEEVAKFPTNPAAYQTRARVRSLFHRFDEATADLAKAESLGAKPESLVASRANLLAARGKLDEAVAMLDGMYTKRSIPPNSKELASLGLLYLEVGREADGTTALEKSRTTYRDVAPFPLAWLDYQEAVIRERHGQEKLARQLYVRATRLLPTYAAAASHLSPYLGARESASMLQLVARRSDDPEVLVFLAASLEKLGKKDEADKDIKAAASRYDDLVRHHEAAFADHAARFWLGPGNDHEKAFVLAEKSLAVRQTSPAFDLALSAALVTKHDAEACDIATRGLLVPHIDDSFRAVATTTVASRCHADASTH